MSRPGPGAWLAGSPHSREDAIPSGLLAACSSSSSGRPKGGRILPDDVETPRAHPPSSRPRGSGPPRRRPRPRCCSARSRWGALALAERTWVPAMVPWRATEEGFVTAEVLDWYGRFARGRARRARRRGDRHPRRAERAAAAHRPRPLPARARGAGRDRPARERRAHAALHPDHRLPRHPAPARSGRPSSAASWRSPTRHREALAGAAGASLARRRRRGRARARCSPLPDEELAARPRRARARGAALRLPRAGHRHGPAPHPRAAAGAARPLRRRRRRAERGRLRRRRAALRPRLHDGLLPLGA